MVPRGRERILYIGEYAFAIVFNAASFAMHKAFGSLNLATEGTDYALMT
jgi:hypothetical protein